MLKGQRFLICDRDHKWSAAVRDVILDRPPDADVAAALWAAIERGQGHGMVPAHGVTTIFYLLEKARDAPFAREGVERLVGVFAVAPVDDNVVRRALALAWPDFEDAALRRSCQREVNWREASWKS